MVEWILTYAGAIALGVLLAERLARLTPNKTDDAVVNILRKVLRAVGVDFPNIEETKTVENTESNK